MTFRTMAMLMGPEAGAGGGGGAGGAAAGAGGAAGGTAGAGAGAKGGAAGGDGKSSAGVPREMRGAGEGGSAGAPPAGATQEEIDEWEDNGRKFRVSKSAQRIAYQREQAVNNRNRTLDDRQRQLDAADSEREQFEGLLEKGDLDQLLHGRFKGDKVALAAKWFKNVMEHENRMMDPAQRELMEKAGEAEKLRAQVQGYQRAETQAKLDAETNRRLKQVSDRYMPALDKLGLPKNDITVALMRGEDRTNKSMGLNLTPEQLAESTKGALVELVDQGLTKDMTPGQAIVAFPTLARLIHKGLIEAEMGRRNGTQAKPVVNSKKAAANGTQKNGEGDEQKGPRVMDHAEIQKVTGLWGL